MFDRKKKMWTAPEPSQNRTDPEGEASREDRLRAQFEAADFALASVRRGAENAEAVYAMEQTAKAGSPDACLAMAQLFEYGWAVSKSKKQALYWYQKAAEAGSAEAKEYLRLRKRARTRRLVLILAAVLAAAGAAAALGFFLSRAPAGGKHLSVKLPAGVRLTEPWDMGAFGDRLYEMTQKYDSVTGKDQNGEYPRILLVYGGTSLDLSGFGVVDALSDGEEYLVLQFANKADAQACLDYLLSLKDTVYAGFDGEYDPGLSACASHTGAVMAAYTPVYHSSATGYDYYSYGVELMGLDKYSAFLQGILPADHHLTVGVIDSGIEPQAATANRIVSGHEFFFGTDGKLDFNGHGTHVSGIILDCTQGLNVDVMPIGIIAPGERYTERSYFIWGLQYAIDQQVDVINLSVGGPASGDSRLVEYYVNQAIDQGIPFVTSAGNDATDAGDYSPARVDRCITVAGIDSAKDPYVRTNYGSVIDVCAPGVDVVSYYPLPEGMASLTGTSMSSPHVAALVAMMQLEFHESPDVISFYVRSYVQQLGNGADYEGAGLPDAGMLVE